MPVTLESSASEQPAAKTLAWAREVLAAVLWTWAIIKLLVFDVDVWVVRQLAPTYEWLLGFRILAVLTILAVAWIVSRQSSFFALVAFILFYPFVLIGRFFAWCYRHWPLLVAFAPPLYLSIRRARTTFLFYALALVAAVVIVIVKWTYPLIGAGTVLSAFLLIHVGRRLREAFGRGLFKELALLTRKTEAKIVDFGMKDWLASSPNKQEPATTSLVFDLPEGASQGETSKIGAEASTRADAATHMSQVYIFHAAAELISRKVSEVAHSRRYDVYLILSWIYSALLATTVYAFQYVALNKVAPRSFGHADGAGFWDFFGFSLGILTTSSVTEILPVSGLARILCHSEVLCSALILIILAFSLLTSARESYREDVEEFRQALLGIAAAAEQRAAVIYHVTMSEMEYVLIEHHAEVVNFFRRQRGQPELSRPAKPAELSATGTTPQDASERPTP